MSNKSNEKRSRRSTYEIARNEPIPNLKKGYFHVLNANNGKGKTHYLSEIAQWCLRDLNLKYLQRDDTRAETDKYTNLICLSGTAFDKFDRYGTFKKYLSTNNRLNHFYYYTGYTTNNNMSSLQIPFRTLCEVLSNFAFYNPDFNFTERARFLYEKIKELKFKDEFKVKLQSAKNDKIGKKETIVERVVSLTMDSNNTNIDTINSFLKYIKSEELEVQDIIFDKIDRQGISIYDLSSGEYAFLRALFVLSFATQPNSLIILDEPENSLHPEWQQNIIEYIIETIEKFGSFQATILIATHSPLITSGFSVKNVMVSKYLDGNNEPFKFEWISYKYYGWSTNLILTEQFHLLYPRDKQFSKLMNDTLELYANQYHLELDDLKLLISNLDKLENLNIKLSEIDPLHDVLQTLLNKKEDISLLLENKNNE